MRKAENQIQRASKRHKRRRNRSDLIFYAARWPGFRKARKRGRAAEQDQKHDKLVTPIKERTSPAVISHGASHSELQSLNLILQVYFFGFGRVSTGRVSETAPSPKSPFRLGTRVGCGLGCCGGVG
jgi:hypothetical protein